MKKTGKERKNANKKTQACNKDRRDEFLGLFGVWAEDDEEEFYKRTIDLEEIDMREWG